MTKILEHGDMESVWYNDVCFSLEKTYLCGRNSYEWKPSILAHPTFGNCKLSVAIFNGNLKSLSNSKKRKKGVLVTPAIVDSFSINMLVSKSWWKDMTIIHDNPVKELPGILFFPISWSCEEGRRCWFQSCFHLHPIGGRCPIWRAYTVFFNTAWFNHHLRTVRGNGKSPVVFHHHRGCSPAPYNSLPRDMIHFCVRNAVLTGCFNHLVVCF